ncbi:class I SAM-dependent methyltransferase [Candidatus Bathyarchaeota archaeon]|nr:class I SAM-dependent methyltransferase [Candidatus Bathyarchaeota archaeon]
MSHKKMNSWKSAAEQHKNFIMRTIGQEDKRRKFYEDPKYIERVHSTSLYRKINDPWLVELLKGRTVLELGCGASPQDHLGQADITSLPFPDDSIDAVLTIAVLEHIPEPERVLQEVVRVLRPGGVVVHQDAWNVPPWRPLGLKIKRYSKLPFHHRILKLLLPILESLPTRFLRIIPKRIIREILFVMRRWKFDYKQIKPNYDLPEVSDADACSSIDSHAVLLFYKANGFKVVKPKDSFLRRLLTRGYIVVQKR